jgi:hypothetical protein
MIAASRGLGRAMFIRCGEPLGTFNQGPESLPQVIKRVWEGKTGGKIPSARANRMVEK